MSTITVLLILLACFTALIITVFQYYFKVKNKGKVILWLSLLRFLSIFLILILFINPTFTKTSYQLVKPKLYIAIDDSQSIKFNNNDSTVINFVKKLKNSKVLNSKFEINYYSFGKTLTLMDSLNFNKKETNLALPIQTITNINTTSKNPIILLSDGNQTVGNLNFSNIKNSIYPVIVGDTSTFEDIKISTINVNETTNIDNNFPVEVFINYNGKHSIHKKVKIFNNKNLVFSKEIKLTEFNNSINILTYLKADKKGTQIYKVVAETLANEKNIKNNSAYFTIKVIEKPIKIAIVSNIVHPDISTLKKSIESKKKFKITLIKSLDKGVHINDYQLYILYQPNSKFKTIFNQINDFNKNYFLISGQHTDWDYLNLSQTYFTKNISEISENFKCLLNNEYEKFLIKDVDFNNFSPLISKVGDFKFNGTYEPILFKENKGIKTKQPILVTLIDNNRKIGILNGENIWKWRMQSFNKHKSFLIFDNFITNLVQYLAENNTKQELKVTAESIFYSNEPVEISATYFNDNSEIDIRKNFWLNVFDNQKKEISKIPFLVSQNQYKVILSNLKSGNYTYTITDKKQKVYYSSQIKITNFNVEEQFQNSNYDLLQRFAKASNGHLFFQNDFEELEKNLIANKDFRATSIKETTKEPLINYKWILFLIALLLSTEWFVRKYVGKM